MFSSSSFFFIFLSYKYIEKTKKRKKKGNQNEAPPLQKPADDFSVLFLKVKLPFACWLPSAMPQQKGEGGLISQGLRGRNPPPPPTTTHHRSAFRPRINFQRGGIGFACRPFILPAACQRANFMPQPSFLFRPERRAQLHPLQADESYITWMRPRAGEPYLPLGTAGRLIFLWTKQKPDVLRDTSAAAV